ncbi:helix-turn-helix domain-containing protein [uncultured Desulfovibrio sp.]|uniref:helix-turn-helix domain-containing protein n=1 Tax=uncultured Desulfovibrio sp. TaxID=167968 RepID=UPI00271207EF|nr:helix-turn-helix domain-containing protein [uncultured Desulfovibrio sp.]
MSDVVVISPDKLSAIVRQAVMDALSAVQGNAAPGNRDYLNEVQAAEYLGLKANTLRNWRAQKRGPAYCKGAGSVRYTRADLDAWLAGTRILTIEDSYVRREMPC